jgi:RNA polymerase sigma factor (sigma-70 family)
MSRFLQLNVSNELIAAAKAGDSAAHSAIYQSSSRAVYTLIRRLIPRVAIADELLHDVFVEILKNISSYSNDAPFAAWVRSIAVNKCLMYLRSPLHRSVFWLDAGDESQLVDTAVESAQDDARDLERALSQLAPLTRAVVWLHDVEGYTHHEIARLMRRSPSFSKSQLSRAHQKLRQLLDPKITVAAQDVAGVPPCTSLSTDY